MHKLSIVWLVLFAGAFAQIQERSVRARMEFLASDALQGRASGSQFEHIAATYIASELRSCGVQPGTADGFIQTVPAPNVKLATAPILSAGGKQWMHGKGIAISSVKAESLSGPLQKLGTAETAHKGSFALIKLGESASDPPVREQIRKPLNEGAALVLVADTPQMRQRYAAMGAELPELRPERAAFVILDAEATRAFEALPNGTPLQLSGKLASTSAQYTWNVIGRIPGADEEAILLSAHLDHVGVRGPENAKDRIYNGADDDASGVVAVLELACALAAEKQPNRSVYLALFGSEEVGGTGAQYFLEHPPLPLAKIAANLEFEMIGRPDPKVAAKTLWLTGYERSNLGPELAKQGARIVADPHPEQQFFTRSDNYLLAKRGVVAQTVSSFGLHSDYHQPSDEVRNIDFAHMTEAIQSLVKPVRWLVDAQFRPQWNAGMQP